MRWVRVRIKKGTHVSISCVRSRPAGRCGTPARRSGAVQAGRGWECTRSRRHGIGNLTLPERFDLRAVVSGRLFGLAKDSLDVETVQVFRFAGRRSSQPP